MTREELNVIRGYVSNIQAIKDAHNTEQLPINYGTICTITANEWKLIEELKALEQEPQTFEWCHDCKEYDHDKHCCPRYNKVIRNAVEEMKQCEDAISRQAYIERYRKWGYSEYGRKMDNEALAIRVAMSLPPVTPKPKMGHWIYEKRKRLINETDEGAEYITDYWCKCSKCGGDFGYRKMNDAFCKYCGARMVEPQESEE